MYVLHQQPLNQILIFKKWSGNQFFVLGKSYGFVTFRYYLYEIHECRDFFFLSIKPRGKFGHKKGPIWSPLKTVSH